MKTQPAFTAAFWSGMAAPVALFTPPAAYSTQTSALTAAQSFAIVGGYLTLAAKQEDNGKRQRAY